MVSLMHSPSPARRPIAITLATTLCAAVLIAGVTTRANTQHVQPIGAPTLVPVQAELFASGGALANAFADFDNDGDLDLFVGFNGTPNRLYENSGGQFREIGVTAGVADARPTRAAAWGDFDADGDPDLLVGFTAGGGAVLRVYRNDGGHFTDITSASGLIVDAGAVRQPSFVDIDGDGDLDLFVAFRDKPNMLFQNDGGHFTDIAASVGLADPRKSVGAVWFDYQQDGDLDLYVANQDGDANGFFRNDKGHFTDIADSVGMAWGGRPPRIATQGTVRPCVVDVNNDGVLDLFNANYGPNGLFLGRTNGRFDDVSSAWGVGLDGHYDTCAFADIDNDGKLDFYVNGTVSATESFRDYIYHQTTNHYADVTPPNILALNSSHGVQWADVDGDGALDLALAGSRADANHTLLHNVLPPAVARRSLQIRVVDAQGRATRAGAEVRIYAAGTNRLLGMRLVDTGSGYDSQSDMPVHFGLASMAAVDVEVVVPANGKRTSTKVRRINPASYVGKALTIKAAG